ncbi:uncharacterized protein LOC141664801 [Apium graveolens]|uniref:uncharacterized protein LOC141664801 n=1 Tax=Apium graveolens TaxID=4045 RepID=UPI003D7AB801
MYNCMFVMSSTGGQIDRSINRGGAPYCFKVKGVNYHNMGSFVPLDGEIPKFCQLYIYNTEDEVHNRINAIKGGHNFVDEDIVQSLLEMLDKYNRLVKGFCMVRERISQNAVDEFRLVLISSSSTSGRPNHIGLTPHLGGRLWKQYVVDAFTAIDQYRLDWIRGHQTTIHSNMNHYIRDALNNGDINPENIGKATILPASFTGSKRYMNQYFKGAMRMLKFLLGVDVVDAPDVVVRVFKMKVDQLLDQIKSKNCFGRCIGVVHVIEFQKRGLPHAHMLIWLHPNDRPKITEQIDKMVSAEIPDPSIDPVGYDAIKNYMIHGPCGTDCVKYNSHTYFDECGFPIYKRRKTGITVKKKKLTWIIGHDTATMCLRKKINNKKGCITTITPEKRPLDEVKQYLDGRYICASEASWRIFGFDIHSRWPSVERLPIHLSNDKHVSFKGSQNLQEVFDNVGTKKSKLEAWFDANKTYAEVPNLTYSEFPSKFTWHPQPGIWKQTKRGDVIGRLVEVYLSSGELIISPHAPAQD